MTASHRDDRDGMAPRRRRGRAACAPTGSPFTSEAMSAPRETVHERVTLEAARNAVAEVTPRLTALLRSLPDPAVRAVGKWTAGDVAAHLAHVAELDAEAVRGRIAEALDARGAKPPCALRDIAHLTAVLLDGDPERDPIVQAARIDHAVAQLLKTCRDGERTLPWLLDTTLSRSAVCSHLVYEMLLHGRDAAHSSRLKWTIPHDLARLAIEGFCLAMIPLSGKADRPHQGRPTACEVRLRGGGRFVVSMTDSGPAVLAASNRVDLRISADPTTLLIAMSGRDRRRLARVLTGRIVAWGFHPLHGVRMFDNMRAT
jgi:hypothetical protein